MTTRPIQDLRNLGPVMASMLAEIGVSDENDLRELGVVEAYRRLKFQFGKRTNLNALYAMDAALQDCGFLEITPERKQALKEMLAA